MHGPKDAYEIAFWQSNGGTFAFLPHATAQRKFVNFCNRRTRPALQRFQNNNPS